MNNVGHIIGGDYGEIWIRRKSDEEIELGELLIADGIILQVFDLGYESLMEHRDLARMSGMALEGYGDIDLKERELRNYQILRAKPIFDTNRKGIPKLLPRFFTVLRRVKDEDLEFIEQGSGGNLYIGKVRSGSNVLDIPLRLDEVDVLSHHILIAATTGRGKSNLMKVMLWHLIESESSGILVLDAHDEYYRYSKDGEIYGLSQHYGAREKVHYYTPNPQNEGITLAINIREVKPYHLKEITEFSSAQEDAMYLAYSKWGRDWIEVLLTGKKDGKKVSLENVHDSTIAALKRKIQVALELSVVDGELNQNGSIFTVGVAGERTISDIVEQLDSGEIVILDTSTISKNVEILIASMIMTRIFDRHKKCKEGREINCNFNELPVVSVVLEEAPRVLGGENGNIFKTIAREGRKFKVGLIAITQLPSMIPREIMANLNTKIILGNEMRSERDAIISSAPQDLSKDSKMIASLEKGEAIVSSIFTKFAVPVKIELFEDIVPNRKQKNGVQTTIRF